MNKDEFIEEVNKLGITLDEDKLLKLDKYYHLLIEWNDKINLTRIIEEKDVYLKHFYDSLTLIQSYDLTNDITLCDVGTGAGLPGIVLKIVFPNLKITLVDALNKRINFLNLVIKELDLKDIITIHSRIEEFAKENREKFDVVVSRAVARLNILDELSLPLVKQGGYFISMKANIDEEVKEADIGISKLGGRMSEIIYFTLPKEESIRSIVKIQKIKKTDIKYPRNFDKIKKNPL